MTTANSHDGEKSIPVAYFCSPQHTPEDLARSFGRTKQMLAWMTQKFAAPFPFPKVLPVGGARRLGRDGEHLAGQLGRTLCDR